MGRYADLLDKYRGEDAIETRLSTGVYTNKHSIVIDTPAVATDLSSPGDTNLRTTNLTNLIPDGRSEEIVSSQAEVFDMARRFFNHPVEDRGSAARWSGPLSRQQK